MCRKKVINGAEYLFTSSTYNNQAKLFENTFERRIPKMYTFTYLTVFTFKSKPTEVQDTVKKPNFEC